MSREELIQAIIRYETCFLEIADGKGSVEIALNEYLPYLTDEQLEKRYEELKGKFNKERSFA